MVHAQMATTTDPTQMRDADLLALRADLRRRKAALVELLAPYYLEAFGRGIVSKDALHDWMEKVAQGSLLGAIVEMFHHKPLTLGLLSKCPIELQQRVVNGEKFTYVEGPESIHQLSVDRMNPGEPSKVFENGRVLTVDEQMARIHKENAPRAAQPQPSFYRPKHTTQTHARVVERKQQVEIPPPVELRGDALEKAGCRTVGVVLYDEEFNAVVAEANQQGTTVNEVVRAAISEHMKRKRRER